MDLVKNDTFSCSTHEGNRAKVFYQISINITIIIIIIIVVVMIAMEKGYEIWHVEC